MGDIVEVEIEDIGVLKNRVHEKEYIRKSKQRNMKMDKLKA